MHSRSITDVPSLSAHGPEEALSHLATIVESSDDAIISKTPDRDGTVLTWNSAAARMYHYSAAEAMGRSLSFLLPPDRHDEETEILERINRNQRVEPFDTVRVRKDGCPIHVSLSISPIRDSAGRIVAISHIARDINKRKQTEGAIQESETKLHTFIESSSQGVITVNATGHIELVNAKIEEMFGYTRDELLARKLELLIPHSFRAFHKGQRTEYSANARRRSTVPDPNLTGLRKDGSEFPLQISLGFLPSQRGTIVFASDVTERRQLDERLRQKETQKQESISVLAGGVAHDFNNLLTVILGNAHVLLEGANFGDRGRGAVLDIISSSERAAHLTRQLLAYGGKGRAVMEPVDISERVRAIGELIRISLPKTVELRLDLKDRLPAVEADLSQVEQVIKNLVINGAEAIGEDTPGVVRVTTSLKHVDELFLLTLPVPAQIAPGSYISLEVGDSGCGMDEGTMSRIFDPFFTTKFTGRGLGLAAVQGIVRGHKGHIWVHSDVGRGTTFKILLPAMNIESSPETSDSVTKNLAA